MISAVKQATKYLYVVYWTYKFYLRFLIGYIVPPVLGTLSIVELLSAISHALPIGDQLPIGLKIALAGLLLAAASVLIYHDRRLEIRTRRHAVLLSSIMVLLEAQTLQARDVTSQEATCSDIIDGLVFALEYGRPGAIRVSIVYRSASSASFRIFMQDVYSAFDPNLALHPLESTAAKVAAEAAGTIIYVPWTRCLHGVRISAAETFAPGPHQRFRTTQILANAFQPIEGHLYPDVLQSLLCIQIPIDSPGCAVLCISSGRRDCMGDLDFHAAKVAAALISLASRA